MIWMNLLLAVVMGVAVGHAVARKDYAWAAGMAMYFIALLLFRAGGLSVVVNN